jgi:hypothetical protein
MLNLEGHKGHVAAQECHIELDLVPDVEPYVFVGLVDLNLECQCDQEDQQCACPQYEGPPKR